MNIKVLIHKNWLPVPGNLQTDHFSPVGGQRVLLLMGLKPHGAYSGKQRAWYKATSSPSQENLQGSSLHMDNGDSLRKWQGYHYALGRKLRADLIKLR